MQCDNASEWRQAAFDKLSAYKLNGTWTLVPCPKDSPVIGSKWVFIKKYQADGSFEHYKICLIAQGFSQCPGFEYIEVFAPTVCLPTLRVILALAAIHNLHLWSVNISNTYLNDRWTVMFIWNSQRDLWRVIEKHWFAC